MLYVVYAAVMLSLKMFALHDAVVHVCWDIVVCENLGVLNFR